jgi:uncharacterized Rmd1/YagE family protein
MASEPLIRKDHEDDDEEILASDVEKQTVYSVGSNKKDVVIQVNPKFDIMEPVKVSRKIQFDPNLEETERNIKPKARGKVAVAAASRARGLPQLQTTSNRRRRRRQRALKPAELLDDYADSDYEAYIAQGNLTDQSDRELNEQRIQERKRIYALEKASKRQRNWRVAAHCFANKLEQDRVIEICTKYFGKPREVNDEVVHVILPASTKTDPGNSTNEPGLSEDDDHVVRSLDDSGEEDHALSIPEKLVNRKMRKDLFVFTTFGSIVCWATDEKEEKDIVDKLTPAALESERLDFMDSDDYEFSYFRREDPVSGFSIFRDMLFLPINLDEKKDLLYKLSCSYALATSSKMGVFEEQVDSVIRATENIPKELAEHGRVLSLSRRQVSCTIGELFIYKASLNLMYDILDAPEFFWDYPELEEVYNQSRKHVEIADRVEVLNKRMEVLSELLSILQQEKSESHSSRLEWIVIWLIVMELVIGIFEILISIYK